MTVLVGFILLHIFTDNLKNDGIEPHLTTRWQHSKPGLLDSGDDDIDAKLPPEKTMSS